MSGYWVGFAQDDVVRGGSLIVRDYTKDGVYRPAIPDGKPGGLVVTIRTGNRISELAPAPASSLVVRIESNGTKGRADFSGFRMSHGGPPVSGSLAWTCSSVNRE